MRYMQEFIKFIQKKRSGVLALLFFVLNFFTNLYSEEIKSFFSLQLNINLPIYEILTAIFATGMVIGAVTFAIQGVWSLLKSNKIKFYNSRNELPVLKDILLQAKQEISFIGVSLEKELLDELDSLVSSNKFPNRSQAIRFLIRKNRVQDNWKNDKTVASVVA